MNVVRPSKAAGPPRSKFGRLNGRLKERTAVLANKDITIPPKYQFDLGVRGRPRVRSSTSKPTTSSSNTPITTPAFLRRKGLTSTSSAFVGSSRSDPVAARTPGTSSTDNDSPASILAITTGRGDARTEVGMAAIDLRYPHLILCQISDCQTYMNALTKIYIVDPLEVLMPDTLCDSRIGRGRLFRSVAKKFPGLEVTPISRAHFNESMGMERVRTLCAKEYSSVELFIKEKYYALAAAAALLKYVECIQKIAYVPKSLRIEFQGSPYATVIDVDSAQSLELVSSQSGHRHVTLLGVLDHCSTPMGRRLLRAAILQPTCNEDVILERQTCVAEMVNNKSLRAVIQPIVRRLYGSDRLLSMSMQNLEENRNTPKYAEQNLNFVLLLKNSLDIVPELHSVLKSAYSTFFRKFCESLANPEFRVMKEKILRVIHSDARSVAGYTSSNMQRCFAIKAGLNDLLDVARQTYCEVIDDMKTIVDNLASQYKLPLSLACSSTLGYHIQAAFPRRAPITASEFPKEFIEIRKNRNTFTMTTKELLVASQQCKISSDELHIMSNILLCDLIKSVRVHVGCLFQLSADVAELDLILSLAQVSSIPEYVRPEFDNKLELENSVHPIIATFGNDNPVPNDVRVSAPHNFHVITGPNMSGKSTYLKQVILLQIMAQIGCYVPAAKATFRIADRIFCRISFHDDIECNASTFTIEILEAQYILQSVTSRSLVVLDELCRGTTVDEGSSIAWGIYERLAKTSAYTFAATHFPYLTKLADVYYNVINHYFETVPFKRPGCIEERLTYTHRLVLGTAPATQYGITLAQMSGLPKSIPEQARKFADQEYGNVTSADESPSDFLVWDRKCYEIVAKIYDLIESNTYDQEHLFILLGEYGIHKEKSCINVRRKPEEPNSNIINTSSGSNKHIENNPSETESTTDRGPSTSTDESFNPSIKRKLSMESRHIEKMRKVELQGFQTQILCNQPTIPNDRVGKSTLIDNENSVPCGPEHVKTTNMISSQDLSRSAPKQKSSLYPSKSAYIEKMRKVELQGFQTQILSNQPIIPTDPVAKSPLMNNDNSAPCEPQYIRTPSMISSQDFTLSAPSQLSSLYKCPSKSFLEGTAITSLEENERLSMKSIQDCVANFLTPEQNPEGSSNNENQSDNISSQLDNAPVFTPQFTSTPKASAKCPSDSDICSLSFSNVSMLTINAQQSAREKEARIFRKIEGEHLNESKYFKTESLPITIDLTQDDKKTDTLRPMYKFPFF